MSAKKMLNVVALVALVYLISPTPAYAYLDPGTGSFIFQLVIAGLAGAAFVIKMYWKKIKTFFAQRFLKDDQKDEDVVDV